jgi:hypothetical protein
VPGSAIFDLSIIQKHSSMSQPIEKIKDPGQSLLILRQHETTSTFTKKIKHLNVCAHRTADGYCNRSNRQCPAKLFTVTFNH